MDTTVTFCSNPANDLTCPPPLICYHLNISRCVALPYSWWNSRLVALVDNWYERRRVVDEAISSYFVLRRSWRDVGAATAARAEAATAAEIEAKEASRPPTPAVSAEPGAAAGAASGDTEEAGAAGVASGAEEAGAADAPAAPIMLSRADAADGSVAAHARWEATGLSGRGHVIAVQHGSKKYDCVVTLVVVPGRRYRVWCVVW